MQEYKLFKPKVLTGESKMNRSTSGLLNIQNWKSNQQCNQTKILKGDIDVIDEEQYKKIEVQEYDEPETNNTPLSHITQGSKHLKSITKVDEEANPRLVFLSESKSS